MNKNFVVSVRLVLAGPDNTGIIQLHYNGMIYHDGDIDIIFIFLMNGVLSEKVEGTLRNIFSCTNKLNYFWDCYLVISVSPAGSL